MSGHKRATVTLSEADLRKLAGVEARLRRVEEDYQDIRGKARQEQDAVLWQGLQALQDRQQQLQDALGGLDGGLAEVEAAAAQAFREQAGQAQAALDTQLAALGDGLWQETAALLDAQQAQLQALAAESQSQRQAELVRLEGQWREEQAGRFGLAQHALQAAGVMLAELEGEGERLFPAEVAQVRGGLELAGQDLALGAAEAALAGARQAYLAGARLRMELERRLWQRHCLLGAALGRARQVYERASHLAQVAGVDLDGDELEVQIDVDYWSGGEYRRLVERCRELLEQLETGGEALDEAGLVDVQQAQLPELEAGLAEAVYQARRSVLASQVRYNLAECVVQALAEQGFALQGGGYRGSDPRRDYQAVVRHYDGSEVLVQVTPLEAQVGMSQLDLLSRDAEPRTTHELRQRGREIARALQAYGLRVGRQGATETTEPVGVYGAEAGPQSEYQPDRVGVHGVDPGSPIESHSYHVGVHPRVDPAQEAYHGRD